MILPFDELNNIMGQIESESFEATVDGKTVKLYNVDACVDIVLDALIMAYVYGVDYANETLGTNIPPTKEAMREAIYKKVADKDFEQRIREYAEDGKLPEIQRVIETDMTRVFNEGTLATGNKAGAKMKTWLTMMDDRVRDSHSYLEGMTVPIDAEFYTFDGDHAAAPGGFLMAENNVNCRCILGLS